MDSNSLPTAEQKQPKLRWYQIDLSSRNDETIAVAGFQALLAAV
jgi:hypothetical protein